MSSIDANRSALDSPKIIQVMFYLGLFVSMVLGMLAKAAYDNILANKSLFTQDQVLLNYVLPALISPIVFLTIYKTLQNMSKPAALLFAFQNGFFWKTVFGEIQQGKISYTQ
jgi:uncharacterized membrane protein